jgi:hypothetical protein
MFFAASFLLHCFNVKTRTAREEAWEGKDPGSVRVHLSNPQWENRHLRFLELPGGRVMEDGVDEEEAWAGGRIPWGNGGMGHAKGTRLITFSLLFSFGPREVCSGGLIPRVLCTAHH